ncbi:CLUMA_CG019345, isoform A [Clunio marinus]|uniref:CLUMA_CG019345, isoform A n=1 Tax=Clunio marinus TaxID=568069 RepID=A0A1J1J330_9DIPT|nr:CLUMA_CG019345, isoform A [Clunio marinus]
MRNALKGIDRRQNIFKRLSKGHSTYENNNKKGLKIKEDNEINFRLVMYPLAAGVALFDSCKFHKAAQLSLKPFNFQSISMFIKNEEIKRKET